MADVPPPCRPTLRSIASLLGVTPATVSLALRDSAEISPETRARVKRAAESLGYHPDPEIGKLMQRLRATRSPSYRSTLYALTDLPAHDPRTEALLRGARTRATELGFHLALEPWPSAADTAARLHRCLLHRGVEGLLLMPMHSAAPLPHCEGDWSQFSIVSTSRQPVQPDFDRVVAHWYWSVARALQELVSHGYRRVGLVYSTTFDRSINHKLTAAIAHRDAVPSLRSLALFAYADPATLTATRGDTIESWFARETPEAIVIDHEGIANPLCERLALRVPDQVALATLNRAPDSALAGVSERWSDIGSAAVNLLGQKVICGHKGPPTVPMVTMVKGTWVHGPSVCPR